VRFVELSRSTARDLHINVGTPAARGNGTGFQFLTGDEITQSGGVTNATSNTATSFAALFGHIATSNGDMTLLFDALETKGLSKTLAEPNLVTMSGDTANFLAGGEFPIPVPQGLNQVTVQFKQFGVSLAFVATILDGGRISLNVKPEVSELSSAGAITLNNVTIPALTTRRAETTVDLASGQSFAIAGLMQNNATLNLSKYPGLGDVPVLGQLFRSKSFQRHESELVIIVTPYLVKPVSRPLTTPLDHLADTGAAPPPSAPIEAAQPAAPPEKKG
jgi:pilus assembly protein CpaC